MTSTTCPHLNSQGSINVIRLTDQAGEKITGWTADLTLTCQDCGKRFGFRTAGVGVDPTQPLTDPSATELRIPLISPDELEELGPLAALTSPAASYPALRLRRGLKQS